MMPALEVNPFRLGYASRAIFSKYVQDCHPPSSLDYQVQKARSLMKVYTITMLLDCLLLLVNALFHS